MAFNVYVSAVFNPLIGSLDLWVPNRHKGLVRVLLDHVLLGEYRTEDVATGVVLSPSVRFLEPRLVRLVWLDDGTVEEGRVWTHEVPLATLASAQLSAMRSSRSTMCVLVSRQHVRRARMLQHLMQIGLRSVDGITLVIVGAGAGASDLMTNAPWLVIRQIAVDCDSGDVRGSAWRVDEILKRFPAGFSVALCRASAAVAARLTEMPLVETPWTPVAPAADNVALRLRTDRAWREKPLEMVGRSLVLALAERPSPAYIRQLRFSDYWLGAAPRHSGTAGPRATLIARAREAHRRSSLTLLVDGSAPAREIQAELPPDTRVMALRHQLVGTHHAGRRIDELRPELFASGCIVYPGSDPDLDFVLAEIARANGGAYISHFHHLVGNPVSGTGAGEIKALA